jgi:GTPase SAR1 family protein
MTRLPPRRSTLQIRKSLTRAHQWISEVVHFCSGLPIILVGCKKDLRYDQKTIEELHKTSQKPVTPEQVRPLHPVTSTNPNPEQHMKHIAHNPVARWF